MNLYLNTRWRLDDIKKVIERLHGKPIDLLLCDKISVDMLYCIIDGKRIIVFVNTQTPIGSATTLNADSDLYSLLIKIADVLGGFLEDVDGKYEKINGRMFEEDGIPYFAKYAILKNGIEPDDFKGFIKSTNDWHLNVEHKDIDVLK